MKRATTTLTRTGPAQLGWFVLASPDAAKIAPLSSKSRAAVVRSRWMNPT